MSARPDSRVEFRLLSVNDAARYLGVSRRTVYVLQADGSLSYIVVGAHRRLDVRELDDFIERNRRRCGRGGAR